MGSGEPRMWAHGYVSCGNCGYDSEKVNEVHVYEVGRESLECPMCRSLDCREIDVDGDQEPGPSTIEFTAPEGLMVMEAIAVFDCADEDGENIVVVDGGGLRKVQTLGLLGFAEEMVRMEAREEYEGGK